MIFNYKKLYLRIVEFYDTQDKFAKAMNLSEETISKKLNNKTRWTDQQIAKAIELLEIDEKEIKDYFFKEEVQTV